MLFEERFKRIDVDEMDILYVDMGGQDNTDEDYYDIIDYMRDYAAKAQRPFGFLINVHHSRPSPSGKMYGKELSKYLRTLPMYVESVLLHPNKFMEALIKSVRKNAFISRSESKAIQLLLELQKEKEELTLKE